MYDTLAAYATQQGASCQQAPAPRGCLLLMAFVSFAIPLDMCLP